MKVKQILSGFLVAGLVFALGTFTQAQRVNREALIKNQSDSYVQLRVERPVPNKPTAEVGTLAAEVPTEKKAIIGSWLETVTFSGPMPPLRSLVTFGADSSVIVADQGAVGTEAAFSAGHGSWLHSGGRTFNWTTVELIYSTADGTLIGYLKVKGRYTVDGTGNAYTGEFLATVSAPDGTVLFSVDGTNSGTRISVESLP